MALQLETDEEELFDGRMSWLGALMDWKSWLTLGIWVFVNRFGSRYTVTTHRVYQRYGLISKSEKFIRADEIRDVALRQGVIARILRYGTIEVSTAGRGGSEIRFKKVGSPSSVRDTVEQLRADIDREQRAKPVE